MVDKPEVPVGINRSTYEAKPTDWTSQTGLLQPSAIFICNPNNPTGTFLRRDFFEALENKFPQATLIIDEAFIHFAEPAWDSIGFALDHNCVLIRSMTKAYAMPGVRLGYAVGRRELVEKMARLQPTWSVGAVAQASGLAALKERAYLQTMVSQTKANRSFLTARLRSLGFDVIDSQANFVLVKVGDAASVKSGLLKQGLLVRDCNSFGLPEYIRIAVRTLSECQRLAGALEALAGKRSTKTGEKGRG